MQISGAAGLGATLASHLPASLLDDAARAPKPLRGDETIVPSVCEMCFWKCGVQAHVKDGKVRAISGNPHHPLSKGKLCPRGVGAVGTLYDPDRLSVPLIRTGERGEQKFREASWEEALDVVADNFRKIIDRDGPEAIAMLYHGAGGSFFKTLMKGMGSPNIAAPSYAQCRGPRAAGFELTFGSSVGSPEPLDIPNCRAMVLIGSHLGENMHNTQVQDFAEGMARGMKLFVVDPRHSVAAGKAERWLPIKPGADIALLLCWIREVIENKWYDKAYVAKRTIGLDKLRTAVARYTPAAVAIETGLTVEAIQETIREVADAAPHCLIHPGRHVVWYGDDAQRSRAIAILNALLGTWGRRGGIYLPSRADLKGMPNMPANPDHRVRADQEFEGQYPFASGALASGIREATLTGKPYDIKAWMVYGTNLPIVLPNKQRTIEAMQKLDFMLAIDILPAEVCGYADVVLPECTYLERHDDLIVQSFREPFVAMRQPVVEPLGDSKPGWWMAKEIAKRLGLESYFPWDTPSDLHAARLTATGYGPEKHQQLIADGAFTTAADPLYLEDDEEFEFDTSSGKIELYSQDLADAGFDPVPQYKPQDPGPAGSYRLLTGRSPVHTFGRTANNKMLLQQYPENLVWLSRAMAEDEGLENGDYVMLTNQDGVESGPVQVKATERIRHDCVYLVHGFGRRERRLTKAFGLGASDSDLFTKFKVDPLMGGTGMNLNFVSLRKVRKPRREV